MSDFFVGHDVAFPKDFLETTKKMAPKTTLIPPKLSGGDGHGTIMATIAAGRINGIARNADLVLLKSQAEYNYNIEEGDPTPLVGGPDKSYKFLPGALERCFSEIRRRVEEDPNGRHVVNMSWGKYI